jgi:hypothetical protein
MPKYLTIHHETAVDRLLLESRWTEISMDSRAEWIMTAFNLEEGRRWCEWAATDPQAIEEILRDLGIKWSEIVEVEVTRASQQRLWEERSEGRGVDLTSSVR